MASYLMYASQLVLIQRWAKSNASCWASSEGSLDKPGKDEKTSIFGQTQDGRLQLATAQRGSIGSDFFYIVSTLYTPVDWLLDNCRVCAWLPVTRDPSLTKNDGRIVIIQTQKRREALISGHVSHSLKTIWKGKRRKLATVRTWQSIARADAELPLVSVGGEDDNDLPPARNHVESVTCSGEGFNVWHIPPNGFTPLHWQTGVVKKWYAAPVKVRKKQTVLLYKHLEHWLWKCCMRGRQIYTMPFGEILNVNKLHMMPFEV